MMPTDKCTTIAVGRAASMDGSCLNTHTADCAEFDWRINKVPARDWPEGSMRTGEYPRQVREDRGFTWSEENLENVSHTCNDNKNSFFDTTDIGRKGFGINENQRLNWKQIKDTKRDILGYIPQVPHTFALIEGLYGIMNEHQVAVGESTCAAKIFNGPKGFLGSTALLEVSELSQIALERARTRTAREAITVMGQLAERHGYYSAEWDLQRAGLDMVLGEAGEALTVTDPLEAWVFHILPDDTGTSAVWSVRALQHQLEAEMFAGVAAVEEKVLAMLAQMERNHSLTHELKQQVSQLLTDFNEASGQHISVAYRQLLPVLVTTYRDGYVLSQLDQPAVHITKMFYPQWWLQQVGYFSVSGIDHSPDSILLSPQNPSNPNPSPSGVSLSTYLLSLLLTAVASACVALSLATTPPRNKTRRLRRRSSSPTATSTWDNAMTSADGIEVGWVGYQLQHADVTLHCPQPPTRQKPPQDSRETLPLLGR